MPGFQLADAPVLLATPLPMKSIMDSGPNQKFSRGRSGLSAYPMYGVIAPAPTEVPSHALVGPVQGFRLPAVYTLRANGATLSPLPYRLAFDVYPLAPST